MTVGPCSAPETGVVSVDAAMAHCAEITRTRARNFHYGLRLLPEPHRSTLFVIYAWMRRADDLADEEDAVRDGVEAAVARVEALRRATRRTFAGEPPADDPVLVALDAIARRFTLDAVQFDLMLDGQLADLHGTRYDTIEQLEGYCEQVASTVGRICVAVWGATGDEAMRLATRRGLAFQFTNVLRDFREDLGAGRVYLPADVLSRHGIDADALARYEPAEACRTAIVELINRAEAHYAASAPLDTMIDAACRPTLWAMTRIYHELLERLRREPRRIAIGPRVRLSPVRKGAIALSARIRALHR